MKKIIQNKIEKTNNITQFKTKGQNKMEHLIDESSQQQMEYQACLSRVQMKVDNGAKVTEKDIDAILSNMENLAGSYLKQKDLSEAMGIKMSDEEKAELDKAVKKGVAEGYGFHVIK